MITLSEYVSESLLKGMEDTLQDGDDYAHAIEEFNEIKEKVLNIKYWDHDDARNNRGIDIEVDAPIIRGMLNMSHPKYKTICFGAYKPTASSAFRGAISIKVGEEWEDTLRIALPMTGSRSDKTFISRDIKPIFKDIKTFIEYINTNVRR